MHSLEQFVYESSTASDTCGLQKYWTEFVRQFGADSYRVVSASPQLVKQSNPRPPIDIAYNIPPGWREHYREQGLHRYDALLAKALAGRGPFTREEALPEYHSPEAERVVAEAKEFGIPGGIGMTLWLGPGRLAAISLFLPTAGIILDDTIKLELQTASFVFCARQQELSTAIPNLAEAPQLTPRELDVLHWIALGKTKQEIAEHLQVSISCIKRHCENASLKLGVNNMASAVARAMSYGMIVL